MEKNEIRDLFRQFEKITALVIGDAMVDSYLWGKVERISPEAPIPIVSVTQKESRLGGAANVSLNLQALGATPILFSVIGEDEKGDLFRRLMQKRGLSSEGILVDPRRITTVKSRIISNGQHIARVDEEQTDFITPELEAAILKAVRQTVENRSVDVIIFVDYDKGVITPSLFRNINALALEKGIPTAVDPKKRNFGLYENVDLFKPNFKEFVEGTKRPVAKGDFEALKSAADRYRQEQSFRLIFVTLSELGVFISNGTSQSHFPANIRYIADVSGAGDTVMSVASLCLAAGIRPGVMAQLSNLAGGLVCEQAGVVPVDREQFSKELEKTILPELFLCNSAT